MADDASSDDFGLGGYSPNQAWGARPTSHGIWGSLTGGNAYRRTGQINVPLPDGTVKQYPFATGGSGAGAMPVGDYTVNNYRDASTRQSQGLNNLGPGTFDLSNAYDPKVDRVRTDLRLHAGRNDEYEKLLSEGCAVLPPSQWPAFAADLKAHLAANGGSTKFRVQQQDSAGPSVGAIPMPAGGPFEMPQPMALGGPPQSSQAPQVRGSTVMAGMEDDSWGSLIGRFANGVNNAVMSPMFQSGAAMVNAGAEGKNIGAGFLAGGEAAATASKNQFALQDARRKMQQMQQQEQYLAGVDTSDPKWAGIDPRLIEMAKRTNNIGFLEEAAKAKIAADRQSYMHPLDKQAKELAIETQQRELNAPKGEFKTIGHDINGNPIYGFVDPRTQAVTPLNAPGAQTGQSVPSSLTGEAYLKTLDPAIASEIRGYAEGRLPYPTGMAALKPQWLARERMLQQFDPSFDAVNYGARYGTRKNFTSGKAAENIRSLNTAVSHLGTFIDSADALNNTNFMPGVTNTVANTVMRNVSGDFAGRETAFEAARKAVTDEVLRAFKGAGATVHEMADIEKILSSSSGPAQFKGYAKQAVELLKGRLDALSESYNQGMGTTKSGMEFLTPHAKQTLGKMGLSMDEHGVRTTAPAAASPAPGSRLKFDPSTGALVPVGGQ